MRRVIRAFDRVLRRTLGVREFDADPQCLLRIRLTRARRALPLPGAVVPAGARVVELHLWNERIPPMASQGADVAWAASVGRRFLHSLRLLARYVQEEPGLREARALGGATVLAPRSSQGLTTRLGFQSLPYHHPLGRFAEFWENAYTWALMWTFNRSSLQKRSLLHLRRSEIWMTAEDFLSRYGGSRLAPPDVLNPTSIEAP
jgi:hypothetical protein